MKELKAYKTVHKAKGFVNICIRMPIEYYIHGINEVYSDNENPSKDQYYNFDYEIGVDDVLKNQIDRSKKNVEADIDLLKRLGYTIEEIFIDEEKIEANEYNND